MVALATFKILTLIIITIKFFTSAKIQEIYTPKCLGLSVATGNLISEFFIKKEFPTITIYMAKTNNSACNGDEIGNGILKEMNGKLRAIVNGEQRKYKPFDKRQYCIILIIDSIEAFTAFTKVKVRLKKIYPKYYLVILMNGLFDGITEIVKSFWSSSTFTDVNFMSSNSTHASIFTYFPFFKGSCGSDFSLKFINSFDYATRNWSSKNFYPTKATNLHNCTLNIGVSENVPMVIVNNGSSGQISYDGIEVLLIRRLANLFNFNPKFTLFTSIGSASENSSSGLLGSLYNRKNDVAIGTLSLQKERVDYLSASSMFTSIPIVIVIPPPAYVNPFKKLYMPFDMPTWIILLLVFLIGFSVIFITKYTSPTLNKLIVGYHINFPFTNMIMAFLGQTQHKLPGGNFSRFLLGKFLMFSLVIRCMYQGMLYDIMKKEIREDMPKTLDELVDRNYVFYTYESLSKRVHGFRFEKSMKVIKNSEIEYYRRKTLDSAYNGVVFCYEPQVIYLNFINQKSHGYLMLPEVFVTNQMVFYLPENHFMAEKFYDKITWFREFGLTNQIISTFIDSLFIQHIEAESKSKPLTLHELYAIFVILVVGLGLAGLACLLEVSIKFIRKLINNAGNITPS